MSGSDPVTLSRLQLGKDMKDEDKLYRYKGVLYPTIMCPEDHLKALENFQARADDIMLVAYPKCGFNWMVGVLKKMLTAATGTKMESKRPPLIEFMGPEILKTLEQAPSPRLLGAHLNPDNIPASFYTMKPKILVIFRNPKDTLVSYYHFHNNNPVLPVLTWETFFSQFMTGDVSWGSYFDYALAWEQRIDDPNVMIVTYEELKQDQREGIQRIVKFFDYNLTEDQIQTISDESTFTAMKESSANSHGTIGSVIFRKGEVGDWRNHFTPEQSHEMDQAFNKHLAGTRIGAKLNYHLHCQYEVNDIHHPMERRSTANINDNKLPNSP